MMRKLMHNTAVAAGFAALLLTGACASNNAVATEPTDEVVQVTQTETVVTTPETAMVDSSGNVMTESTIAESTVTVTNAPLVEPGTIPDTTALTTTTTTTQTTTVAAPELTPMTSSSTLDTQTTTTTDDTTATTETETRTRLRKD